MPAQRAVPKPQWKTLVQVPARGVGGAWRPQKGRGAGPEFLVQRHGLSTHGQSPFSKCFNCCAHTRFIPLLLRANVPAFPGASLVMASPLERRIC